MVEAWFRDFIIVEMVCHFPINEFWNILNILSVYK